MVSEVLIPVLDQTTIEVVLTRWLKDEGDTVRKGEIICEIETEKATGEIEANADGVLRRILIRSGAAVPSLTVVAVIADPMEPLPDIDPYYRVQRATLKAPVPDRDGATRERFVDPAAHGSRGEKLVASPRARNLAADHGVDLADIVGTGPDGRIIEDDVRKLIGRTPPDEVTRLEQAVADRVTRSWNAIPHFFTTITVDLSQVAARKARAKARVTYTDYFALAIAHALRHQPKLNGFWKDHALQVVPEIHMGLVVQTERGLVNPVLRNLHQLALEEIADVRERIVRQAQAGKLSATVMTGATFTLSNLGAGHIDHFTAIISPPQVAILSVGSIQPRPVVCGSDVVIRPTAMFTLSVDHRAIDGRVSASFLEQLKAELEREDSV